MQAWFTARIGTKKSRALRLMFNLGLLTPKKKAAPLLVFKLDSNRSPRCWWQQNGLVDSPNPNDRARRPAGFNVASYLNRSCHYNSIAWKTAQHFSYGARGFYARPSERSERLKLFVISGICFKSERHGRYLDDVATLHMNFNRIINDVHLVDE